MVRSWWLYWRHHHLTYSQQALRRGCVCVMNFQSFAECYSGVLIQSFNRSLACWSTNICQCVVLLCRKQMTCKFCVQMFTMLKYKTLWVTLWSDAAYLIRSYLWMCQSTVYEATLPRFNSTLCVYISSHGHSSVEHWVQTQHNILSHVWFDVDILNR